MRRPTPLVGMLFLLLPAYAPTQEKPEIRFPDTTAITCWDRFHRDFRTRTLRSRILVAPDKKREAYAETSAAARGKDEDGLEICHNTSSLLARSGVDSFQPVFAQKPTQKYGGGNGLMLVDWSPDSKYLLADSITWFYYSDQWQHTLVVYAAETGRATRLAVNEIFSEMQSRPCALDGQVLGFLPDERVLFAAVPKEDANPCVDEPTYFAIDLGTSRPTKLPAKPQVRHNGGWKE